MKQVIQMTFKEVQDFFVFLFGLILSAGIGGILGLLIFSVFKHIL